MSSWAPEIASALPVALNALVEMCLGWGIVERHWLWVIHLCELPDFTQRHMYELQKVGLSSALVLCPTYTLFPWPHSSKAWVCFISGWMDSRTGAGLGCWFVSGFFVHDQQLCNQTWPWPYLSGRSSIPSIMSMCHVHSDEPLVACNLWAGSTRGLI